MQVTDEMVRVARKAYRACRPVERVVCQDFGMQQDDILDQQLEAALTAALAAMWQPIETAPKDGTRIIAVGWDWGIVWNERHVTTVIWRQDREEWCETDDSEDDSACAYLTHWMPLPAPPVPEPNPRDSSESTTGGAR